MGQVNKVHLNFERRRRTVVLGRDVAIIEPRRVRPPAAQGLAGLAGIPDVAAVGPSVGYFPPTGVNVTTATNIQAAIDANPAGTAFIFADGNYTTISSITPKAGNQFWALNLYGATWDGGNVRQYAVNRHGFSTPDIPDVEFHGLIVKNYVPVIGGHGMIGGDYQTGWVFEDLEAFGSYHAGLKIGPQGIVRRVNCHHNEENGLTGYNCDDTLIVDSAFNDNNLNWTWGWKDATGSAAGIKIPGQADRVVIRNCEARRNNGPGFWFDYVGAGNTLEDSIATDNDGPGIFWEISDGSVGTIRNNYFSGAKNWANIWIANSGPNINVVNNDCVGFGMMASHDPGRQRNSQGPMNFYDNRLILIPSGSWFGNGCQTQEPAVVQIWNLVNFDRNTYTVPATALAFKSINGISVNFAQWQAQGFDVNGSRLNP